VEFRRLSLTYVVAYLGIGGTGFLVAPEVTRQLLLSNQDYEDVGFRLTGMMMLALAYLVWNLVRNQDWKYYPVSIHVRTGRTSWASRSSHILSRLKSVPSCPPFG
jgi:uncharacterized protein YjeT (DUF2065 family)